MVTRFCILTKFLPRDGFGPKICGPGPVWAGLPLGRPNAWAVFKSDFWAWAGPGFSSFGLDQALGRPENHYWANLGHFGHPKTSVYLLAVAAYGRLFGCRIQIFK